MKKIILYHVSNPHFRKKILKEGLIPQMGESYSSHYEGEENMGKVIFVSKDNDYCSTWDDDRYEIVLTEKEFKDLEFKKDKDIENALYTKKLINLKNMKLIHKGTGEEFYFEEGDKCNNINSSFLSIDYNEDLDFNM